MTNKPSYLRLHPAPMDGESYDSDRGAVDARAARFLSLPPIASETVEVEPLRFARSFKEGGHEGGYAMPMMVLASNGMILPEVNPIPLPLDYEELALTVLGTFNADAGMPIRPGRFRVRSRGLADALGRLLAKSDTKVECTEEIPAWTAAALEFVRTLGGVGPPGWLEDNDTTPDQVASFCGAAAAFYRARPWQVLGDNEIIQIETDLPVAQPPFASVLGGGAIVTGVGFLYDRKALEDLADEKLTVRTWLLSFDSPRHLSWTDQQDFARHFWPVAFKKAHPSLTYLVGALPIRRPTADELAYFELAVGALAECAQLLSMGKSVKVQRNVRGRKRSAQLRRLAVN